MVRQVGQHFIRAWRKHRKLSLRKLANRMELEPGVPLTSHANIQRIEAGKQPYTEDILYALSEALNVPVPALLEVDPEKEGQVVDLLKLIDDRNRDQAVRVLKALTGTES